MRYMSKLCFLAVVGLWLGVSAPDVCAEDEVNATLRLVKIEPEPESKLRRSSSLRARVEYTIEGLEKLPRKEFFFTVNFGTKGSDATISIDGPGRRSVKHLKHAEGEVSLTYPIRRILGEPRLDSPIRAYIYLHRKTGERTSRAVAKLGPFVYHMDD